MVVLGCDPGGRTTGLVVRSGSVLLDHALVARGDDLHAYLLDVVQTIDQLDHDHAPARLAVEDLVDPNPHLGLANVRGLIDTAQVIGAIRLTWSDCHMVRPDRHGAVPKGWAPGPQLDAWMRQQYPADLLGPKEIGGAYTGRLRHARSAWDIAGVALTVQQRFGVTS